MQQTNSQTNASAATTAQKLSYKIRPFYGMQPNGAKSDHPTGWDVVEIGERTELIISPCDSLEEAEAELLRFEKL